MGDNRNNKVIVIMGITRITGIIGMIGMRRIVRNPEHYKYDTYVYTHLLITRFLCVWLRVVQVLRRYMISFVVTWLGMILPRPLQDFPILPIS